MYREGESWTCMQANMWSVRRAYMLEVRTAVTYLAKDDLQYSQLNELTDIQRAVNKPECDGHPI